ncbi:MAG: hypothetical protein P8Z35_04540 [Ignavibacteriaceae bacterium]|jgi:hypothetical protein
MGSIKIAADPIIVRGEEDGEKGIWIAVMLLRNLIVCFATKRLGRGRL